MNWKGQLNKQEETKPQFVDPENQEDEEMERVEKFLGRFKKPQPMPFEEWMKEFSQRTSSLENLVGFIISLDTTEGTPLDLLWEQKRQGKQSLPMQVKVLKDFGNDANTIVKEIIDTMKEELGWGFDVERVVKRMTLRFSATLNIRREAEPLLRQLAQTAERSPEVKQMREKRAAEKQGLQQREQQRQQQQQQQQPPQGGQ